MSKVIAVKEFLKHYFNEEEFPLQAFNNKNVVGDITSTIYRNNGVTIDYCYSWDYIEIFGLSDRQFEILKKEGIIK